MKTMFKKLFEYLDDRFAKAKKSGKGKTSMVIDVLDQYQYQYPQYPHASMNLESEEYKQIQKAEEKLFDKRLPENSKQEIKKELGLIPWEIDHTESLMPKVYPKDAEEQVARQVDKLRKLLKKIERGTQEKQQELKKILKPGMLVQVNQDVTLQTYSGSTSPTPGATLGMDEEGCNPTPSGSMNFPPPPVHIEQNSVLMFLGWPKNFDKDYFIPGFEAPVWLYGDKRCSGWLYHDDTMTIVNTNNTKKNSSK